MCPRRSSRDLIVDAAQAVVVEVGAAHMTLDAVAAAPASARVGCSITFRPRRRC